VHTAARNPINAKSETGGSSRRFALPAYLVAAS
jgi:hypothetical protein